MTLTKQLRFARPIPQQSSSTNPSIQRNAPRYAVLDVRRGRVRLSTLAEMRRVIEEVAEAMTRMGYGEHDVFSMDLSLCEALANAIKHGNKKDPTKHVHVWYRIDRRLALVEVQDEGQGFDPDVVPDPRLEENLEKTSGRGLLMMRNYLTEVRYSEQGNRVTLIKARSQA